MVKIECFGKIKKLPYVFDSFEDAKNWLWSYAVNREQSTNLETWDDCAHWDENENWAQYCDGSSTFTIFG